MRMTKGEKKDAYQTGQDCIRVEGILFYHN